MTLCAAPTLGGKPCTNPSRPGSIYCGTHKSGWMCGFEVDDPLSPIAGCCALPRGHEGPHGTDYPHGLYQVEKWGVAGILNTLPNLAGKKHRLRNVWTVTAPLGVLGRVAHKFITLKQAIELAREKEDAYRTGQNEPIFTGGAVIAGGGRVYRSLQAAREHGEHPDFIVPLKSVLTPTPRSPDPTPGRDPDPNSVLRFLGKEGWAAAPNP